MAGQHGSPGAVWAYAEHEHRELLRGVDRIHAFACEIGTWVSPELPGGLTTVLEWFDDTLTPHVAWEEAWLYPEVDARTGTPWATRLARYDHGQVRDAIERLRTDQLTLHAAPVREHLSDLRWHLFTLEVLLRAHIEREERFLMPILAN